MNQEQIEQLKKLAKIFAVDKVITTEDTQEVLKAILILLNKFKKENEQLNKETRKTVDALISSVNTEYKRNLLLLRENNRKFNKDIRSVLDLKLKEIKKIGENVKDMAPKDGEDGLDGKDGEDGSPDTPDQVRDKLESLKEGKKLSISAIEDLGDLLERLEKMIKEKPSGSNRGGGGGRITRFIDDETPVGTIDGVNTDFTTSKSPLDDSLKVYRNGSRMRITEDYTFSYKTITFLVAPQVGEIILVDYRY